MYRLLATDIDDTLIDGQNRLPEVNRILLARLHAHGVRIVFASGRADVSIQDIASRILEPDDDEYYIAFNGARIVTARSRTPIAPVPVLPESVAAVVRYARENGLYLQGYTGDEFVVEEVTPRTERYRDATGMGFRKVDDLVAALPQGSPKLLCIGEPGLLKRHRAALGAVTGCEVFFSKPSYLEIVQPGVNKGSALLRLSSTLQIPAEQTLAVGDSTNDMAMLEAAGVGIAVAGARDEAKRAADLVLSTEAKDGVMEEIVARFFPEFA